MPLALKKKRGIMEDSLKNIEKKIARAKFTPHKFRRKTNVMVIDNYGEMKSGAYIRILARFFSVASLVFGLTTVGLYQLYTHQTEMFGELTHKVAFLEQKTMNLTKEKDIYMARLVLSGHMEGLQTAVSSVDPPATFEEKKSAAKTE